KRERQPVLQRACKHRSTPRRAARIAPLEAQACRRTPAATAHEAERFPPRSPRKRSATRGRPGPKAVRKAPLPPPRKVEGLARRAERLAPVFCPLAISSARRSSATGRVASEASRPLL